MPAESILMGLATGGASNLLSEWHADEAQEREKELMDYQNSLNKVNALDAYRMQTQGMKMAGLNPALSNTNSPQAAAPVSKGSAPHGENVEFDQSLGIMQAQKENIEAQTAKTVAETAKIEGVDTKNVEADTALKAAQRLFTESNKSRVDAEAIQIGNVNKVFQEENYSMGLFGEATANEWIHEPWFNSLSKYQQAVINDIAKGNLNLSVGLVNALERSISFNSHMSDLQNNKVQYALTRSVIESQMKSPKVMKALVKTPEAQYGEVVARATQLGAETKMLNFDYDWKNEQKEVWRKNDPDKLYSEYQKDPTVENAAKWLVGSFRSTGADVLKGATPAVIHGGAMNSALKNSENSKSIKNTYESHTPALYGSDGSILRPSVHTQGVEKMRF